MASRSEEYLIKIQLQVQNDKALKALTTQLEKTAKEAPKAQKAIKNAGKGMNSFGNQTRNVSYQLTDFIVQVQGGTDATRALGQQLPQLLAGFGAFGAAAGVVASLLPALVQLLQETETSAEDAAEAWDKYTEALERFKATGSDVDAIAASLLGATAVEERASAVKSLREEAEKLGEIGKVGRAREASILSRFGSVAEFERYNEIISELNAENIDETAADLARLAAGMGELGNPETVAELERLFFALRDLNDETSSNQPVVSRWAEDAVAANDYRQMLEEVAQKTYELRLEEEERERKAAEARKREAESARRRLRATLQPVQAFEADPEINKRYLEFQKQQEANAEKLKQTYAQLYPAATEYAAAQERINYALSEGIISEERYQQELESATKTFEESTKGWTLAGEMIETFDKSFTTMLDGVLMGTQDLASGFEDMAKVIIAQLLKLLAYKAVFAGFGIDLGLPAGATESAKGNVISGGKVVPFAKGGIVGGPTLFPMKGGAGLMGEAGAEAILPLSRGPGGNLGVSAAPVNVTVNNMASGVRVNTRQTDQGLTLDVVLEAVASSVRQGGTEVSNAMEDKYSLSRGRAVY